MFNNKYHDKVAQYITSIEEMCGEIMDDTEIFPDGYYNEVGPAVMGIGIFLIASFFSSDDPKHKIINFITRFYHGSLINCKNSKEEVLLYMSIMENTYIELREILIKYYEITNEDKNNLNVSDNFLNIIAEFFAKQFNLENIQTIIEIIKKYIQLFINKCKIINNI